MSEVQVCLKFLLSYLYGKIPRRRVDCLAEYLEKTFYKHLSLYPSQTIYLIFSSMEMNTFLTNACMYSGLSIAEVESCLPNNLRIWIEKGKMSYCEGNSFQPIVLFDGKSTQSSSSQNSMKNNTSSNSLISIGSSNICARPEFADINSADEGFVSPTRNSPSDSVRISDLFHTNSDDTEKSRNMVNDICNTKLNLSKDEENLNCRSSVNSQPLLTAAEFAQTKFGSTKFRETSKRSNRFDKFNTRKQTSSLSAKDIIPIIQQIKKRDSLNEKITSQLFAIPQQNKNHITIQKDVHQVKNPNPPHRNFITLPSYHKLVSSNVNTKTFTSSKNVLPSISNELLTDSNIGQNFGLVFPTKSIGNPSNPRQIKGNAARYVMKNGINNIRMNDSSVCKAVATNIPEVSHRYHDEEPYEIDPMLLLPSSLQKLLTAS